jgi:hypothetical protein
MKKAVVLIFQRSYVLCPAAQHEPRFSTRKTVLATMLQEKEKQNKAKKDSR